MRVVATAGHVDHGKSTLVFALTGTDPDRFAEEKARGLTIDIGFAFCSLPSGETIGFVDVPGHVRFVKNMLAGVGAVDCALLVVAANEGWMPQTEEHVRILELLDVSHGVVALTKADLVDDDALEYTRLEIGERVSWPVVAVDGVSGRGLDELRAALDDLLQRAPVPADHGRARLWVDRVFAAKGAGTVVTGTLTGGTLHVDDEVVVEPGGRRGRIRRIESHGTSYDELSPGARCALNLAGVDHNAVRRGAAVVHPDRWTATRTVDVALQPVDGYEFARRAPVDVHVGSGEQLGMLRVLDDEGAYARIRIVDALPLAPGDRLVLRSSAAQATVAGAVVLDVAPARRAADALVRLGRPLADRVLDARPWCTPADFERLAGRKPEPNDELVTVGPWLVSPREVARVRARANELTRDGWPAITSVAADCGVEVPQLRAALGDDALGESPLDHPDARALLERLGAQPFTPASPSELGASPALVRALVLAGALVDLDGIVFTAVALDDARRLVAKAVIERGALTISEMRELLGSTRKFVLPIANRCDADAITRRDGDARVPGARASDWA